MCRGKGYTLVQASKNYKPQQVYIYSSVVGQVLTLQMSFLYEQVRQDLGRFCSLLRFLG